MYFYIPLGSLLYDPVGSDDIAINTIIDVLVLGIGIDEVTSNVTSLRLVASY